MEKYIYLLTVILITLVEGNILQVEDELRIWPSARTVYLACGRLLV